MSLQAPSAMLGFAQSLHRREYEGTLEKREVPGYEGQVSAEGGIRQLLASPQGHWAPYTCVLRGGEFRFSPCASGGAVSADAHPLGNRPSSTRSITPFEETVPLDRALAVRTVRRGTSRLAFRGGRTAL